jgi:hypothetical protein
MGLRTRNAIIAVSYHPGELPRKFFLNACGMVGVMKYPSSFICLDLIVKQTGQSNGFIHVRLAQNQAQTLAAAQPVCKQYEL